MTAPTPRTPTTPYGPLIETRMRVVTWNLWWRLGNWNSRAGPIVRTLGDLDPDLVCLQEVWQEGDRNQGRLACRAPGNAARLRGRSYRGWDDQGVAVLSRWPLAEVERRAIPRRSADRKQQVRALVEFLAEPKRQPPITVLCGDFNAAPGSDEIRLLTGLRPPAVAGWTFLDAWETAGDDSPGYTMVKTNPNSAPLLLPNLRWDDIFVRWPSAPGGIGPPLHAEVAGTDATDGVVPSDHYAVCADLRY